MKIKKIQNNFKLDMPINELLEKLSTENDMTKTDIIQLALISLEGCPVSQIKEIKTNYDNIKSAINQINKIENQISQLKEKLEAEIKK